MKKISLAIGGLFCLLLATMVYNVWRAGMDAVVVTPGPLEIGRQQLHDQLEQAKKRESAIELQDWGSVTLLRELIKAHQQRIDQLSSNSEAAEIVAWDKESIARLDERIASLIAQQSAQFTAQDENGTEPSLLSAHPAIPAAITPSAVPRPITPARSPLSTPVTSPKPPSAEPQPSSVPQSPQARP